MKKRSVLIIYLFVLMGFSVVPVLAEPPVPPGGSQLVYPGTDGTLFYARHANKGEANAVNTVADFSDCGDNGG
jgi:hypothetical protein